MIKWDPLNKSRVKLVGLLHSPSYQKLLDGNNNHVDLPSSEMMMLPKGEEGTARQMQASHTSHATFPHEWVKVYFPALSWCKVSQFNFQLQILF